MTGDCDPGCGPVPRLIVAIISIILYGDSLNELAYRISCCSALSHGDCYGDADVDADADADN